MESTVQGQMKLDLKCDLNTQRAALQTWKEGILMRRECPFCLGHGIVYWRDIAGMPRNGLCDKCEGVGSYWKASVPSSDAGMTHENHLNSGARNADASLQNPSSAPALPLSLSEETKTENL